MTTFDDATFEQLLEKAGRADRAGDSAAARSLVAEARRRFPGMTPGGKMQATAPVAVEGQRISPATSDRQRIVGQDAASPVDAVLRPLQVDVAQAVPGQTVTPVQGQRVSPVAAPRLAALPDASKPHRAGQFEPVDTPPVNMANLPQWVQRLTPLEREEFLSMIPDTRGMVRDEIAASEERRRAAMAQRQAELMAEASDRQTLTGMPTRLQPVEPDRIEGKSYKSSHSSGGYYQLPDGSVITEDGQRLVKMPYRAVPSENVAPPPVADQRVQANGLPEPTAPRQDRFGDTTGAMVSQAAEGMDPFIAGLRDQSQSPTLNAVRDYVPGPLQRPVAAVGDAAGLLATGIGTGIAGAAGLIGEAAGGSPAQERKLARDLVGMSQVAVPELAGVSSTTRVAGNAANAVSKMPTTQAAAAARAAADLGIVPSLGMTGKTGAILAAGLEKVPFSGSVIGRDAARAVGQIEGALNRVVSGIGRAMSPDAAGDLLQGGLKASVDRFKTRSGELFSKVDARIPQDARFAAPATEAAIAGAKEAFGQNPALAAKLGLNEWDAIAAELAQNGVPWQAMKQFRSRIGAAIGDARGSLGDEDLGRLKGLYAALTDDMGAAAKQSGNGAFGAWRAANNHYRSGAERIERSLDATITAKSPERAWEAFSGLLQRDRSSADITRVREIKQAMGDEWGDVAASIVDRLGRARPGQQNAAGDAFSAGTFLTEWSKLAPEAKNVLLTGEARAELDKLALVAERAKAAGAERNFSNTGTAVGVLGTMGGAAVDMGTTAAALGAANLSARGMTSPVFLRALNNWTRGDAKALEAMAGGKGPFATDAKTVLQLMGANAAAAPSNDGRAPLRAVQ